jgi:hypothetical protein
VFGLEASEAAHDSTQWLGATHGQARLEHATGLLDADLRRLDAGLIWSLG